MGNVPVHFRIAELFLGHGDHPVTFTALSPQQDIPEDGRYRNREISGNIQCISAADNIQPHIFHIRTFNKKQHFCIPTVWQHSLYQPVAALPFTKQPGMPDRVYLSS